MATAISPADPMFWLHHSNVDRIWARWQVLNPKEKPVIDVKYKARRMLDPFGVTLDHGASIVSKHGYSYA